MSETRTETPRKTWRSLEELADTPEFRRHVEREFPSALEQVSDPVSRRSFLGLMGAAIALSGLTGCRRPLAKILPYNKMPEDLLPGVPQQYATIFPFRGVAEGILVTSHEGRPTKIEGNPGHPASGGATHLFGQATILDLYDPDRSKHPTQQGTRRSWEEFDAWFAERRRELGGNQGAGLRILVEPGSSPAVETLRGRILSAFPRARFHIYEPVTLDSVRRGSEIAHGRRLRTQLDLKQADVILALDCDLLVGEPNALRHARDYAARRRLTSERSGMNRLYAVEPSLSLTGSVADHRLRLPYDRVGEFAAAVAVELGGQGITAPGLNLAALRNRSVTWTEEERRWVQAVAKDLASHRGRAVLTVGSGQPAEVHALAHAVNAALRSVGTVVRMTQELHPGEQVDSLATLASAMRQGAVDTLLILGGNPVYDAPGELDFAEAMKSVGHVVRFGLYEDETSAASAWHLPAAHSLESWGDGRAWDGTRSIQQPLIAPLYEGISELEMHARILGMAAPDGHEILRGLYGREWGGLPAHGRFEKALHDGVIPGTAYPEVPATVNGRAVGRAWADRPVAEGPSARALDLLFRADARLFDGRFANNGWLQELPDPITKLTWDNAALMSLPTAKALGVENHALVQVESEGRSVTLPVWIVPGMADFTVQLPLGYGRRKAGRIGTGPGFDVNPLRSRRNVHQARGSVSAAGGTYTLVVTQDHHSMEGRPLVREGSLEEYRKHPEFVQEMEEAPPLKDIYLDREYDFSEGNQWGMAIDLTTCTGCNACAIACQSENNIAIVGKDQVRRGREMHWLRIDRYFTGSEEDPEVAHQPLPCMHCENAPCESVCPVNATSHDDEGLNVMTYNRCIGTRYCNNNCPYKVRRFNYFDWNDGMTEVEKMSKNPDVTVRMRGVMEKCTYCVQRINRAKIDAKNEDRPVRDGEIRTACQQVCPTDSIVFGNVNDPETTVSRLKAQNRNYTMLDVINTKPRTSYLARIRNRNPELEGHA